MCTYVHICTRLGVVQLLVSLLSSCCCPHVYDPPVSCRPPLGGHTSNINLFANCGHGRWTQCNALYIAVSCTILFIIFWDKGGIEILSCHIVMSWGQLGFSRILDIIFLSNSQSRADHHLRKHPRSTFCISELALFLYHVCATLPWSSYTICA